MKGVLFALFLGLTLIINAQEEDRGYIVEIGDKAPDFEMELLSGKKVKLSDLKGKVIMLQFTASWCGVCRKEMPFIESEIWQELNKKDDFVLFGIDRDEPAETVTKFIEQTGISYPIALDPGASIFQLYAIKEAGITRNVIIGRDGHIIYLTRLFNREEFDSMKQVIFDQF